MADMTYNSMAHSDKANMFTTETVLVSEKDDHAFVQTSNASVASMDDASSGHHSTKKRSMADLRREFKDSARSTAVSLRRPDLLAKKAGKNTWRVLSNYAKFVGPGFMVSVAYIDPGNYATDVAAGASFRFRLLFIVLMSNIFAIFLQSLSIKLGSVTGYNLAEACKHYCPKWVNIALYVLAEVAIIATDVAEVIGTAIALNLLEPRIPLVAGCAISIADVLIILLFFNVKGSMKGIRIFEIFVAALVMAVVVCFCVQLGLIQNTSAADVFRGYIPSDTLIQPTAIFQACGILGATVMPHSIYLGSGMVQSRLLEYDQDNGIVPSGATIDEFEEKKETYRPSLAAIKFCMKYSMAEVGISLFSFALFVNSAILIVAGASLFGTDGADDADLFGIFNLLSTNVAPAAGTIFALALLFSGVSAGIVCTLAGQMVSEGSLDWSIAPWKQRLVTRTISITPSIIIAGAVGRQGLSAALEGSQVVLSVCLPFITAPLIWFTCKSQYMTVKTPHFHEGDWTDAHQKAGNMRNGWLTTAVAVIIWLIITVMNIANLVLLGVNPS